MADGRAFQDFYDDKYAHCYGCGRLNEHGLKIKSYWAGDESTCRFTPAEYYTGGFPEYLYGGLIASLMDCHAAGTASAANARATGIDLAKRGPNRFVTASLKVDYLAPTPMGTELEVRARVRQMEGRRVWLDVSLGPAGAAATAKGEVLMVQLPE